MTFEHAPAAAEDEGIPFLDCHTFIGRTSGTRDLGGRNLTPADLERELDRHGIGRAVTHHVLAREHHPIVGNAELSAGTRGHPRLLPAWVLLPPHTAELPPPAELVGTMIRENVRSAIMFPGSSLDGHRFSLAPWCVGELLDALQARRVPLALDFGLFRRDEPPWREVFDVCERHPALPVILIEVKGRNNRTLYPLLARFPNLHVQTAGFDVHRGLEDLARRFGPHRLIYGSGYPVKTMGGARLQVLRSGLSPTDKRRIASGNLERLLAAVERSTDTPA